MNGEHVSQDPAKTGRHEYSSPRLCAAGAPRWSPPILQFPNINLSLSLTLDLTTGQMSEGGQASVDCAGRGRRVLVVEVLGGCLWFTLTTVDCIELPTCVSAPHIIARADHFTRSPTHARSFATLCSLAAPDRERGVLRWAYLCVCLCVCLSARSYLRGNYTSDLRRVFLRMLPTAVKVGCVHGYRCGRTELRTNIFEYWVFIEQHVTNVHANHDFKAVA